MQHSGSYLRKFVLYPLSHQCQAVSRTQSPDGAQQNQGQEVQDVRQAGLFCLGEGSRDMCDDEKKVTEGLLMKVEKGKEKEPDAKEQRWKSVFGKVTKNTLKILIVPIYFSGMSTLEQI